MRSASADLEEHDCVVKWVDIDRLLFREIIVVQAPPGSTVSPKINDSEQTDDEGSVQKVPQVSSTQASRLQPRSGPVLRRVFIDLP